MATILSYKQFTPVIHPEAWVADNATIIGDVEIAAGASIWFGCVLRGDVGPIRIGAGSNVQDLCLLHTTTGISRVIVGEDVTVGHSCVLHGCELGRGVLVGMGSVLLDNTVVGDESVVGAGTLLTARKRIPAGSLVMGRPGVVVREATEQERELGRRGAREYRKLMNAYRTAS